MNVTGRTRIYRKDFDGRPVYSRAIASKEYKDGAQTENWIRAYEPVKLPKDTVLADGSTIDVTRGFESVYKKQSGEVVRQLIVMDYSLIEAANVADEVPNGFKALDEDIPF